MPSRLMPRRRLRWRVIGLPPREPGLGRAPDILELTLNICPSLSSLQADVPSRLSPSDQAFSAFRLLVEQVEARTGVEKVVHVDDDRSFLDQDDGVGRRLVAAGYAGRRARVHGNLVV